MDAMITCEGCGIALPQGAMFCGECGRSVPVHPDSGMPYDTGNRFLRPQANDTVVIEPLSEPAPEPASDATAEPASVVEQIPAASPTRDSEPPGDSAQEPDDFSWGARGAAIFTDAEELERTIVIPRRLSGARFILQFSTGESVTVTGTGLLGRNPLPQPGEFFDQLVAISDPGKSVSKTHLEFGQESGALWIADRFSGNGSVLREPESAPRRLAAGKRYRVMRGTRVDIGEQFFIIS